MRPARRVMVLICVERARPGGSQGTERAEFGRRPLFEKSELAVACFFILPSALSTAPRPGRAPLPPSSPRTTHITSPWASARSSTSTTPPTSTRPSCPGRRRSRRTCSRCGTGMFEGESGGRGLLDDRAPRLCVCVWCAGHPPVIPGAGSPVEKERERERETERGGRKKRRGTRRRRRRERKQVCALSSLLSLPLHSQVRMMLPMSIRCGTCGSYMCKV